MPIDQPEATAAPTNRRTFLVRAALGGALVSVGPGPLTRLLPVAGASPARPAQVDAAPELDDEAFAMLAAPLELAAVQVYSQAQRGGQLDATWADLALRFQGHHQTVAETLETLITSGETPEPDDAVLTGTGGAIEDASDQNGVLAALAELEEVLAATHLYGIGGLTEAVTARLVAQVMAVEAQHAVALGLALGTDPAELTPPTASTDGARTGEASDPPLGGDGTMTSNGGADDDTEAEN
ncbi:hypothetical protein BH23ACT2_BH23ACT2_08850 [soil metagenome]